MASIDYKQIGKDVLEHLNCTKYEELYEVLNFDVLQKFLKHKFRKYFNAQTLTFIRTCYPDWEVCSWKFKSPLKNQWTDKDNRLFAINYIAKQKGWTTRNDFYKLSNIIINEYLGKGFLDIYKDRLYDVLVDLYPPNNPKDKWADDFWIPWMVGQQEIVIEQRKGCRSTPKGIFGNEENRKWCIEWLCKRLNFTIPQQLNRLTQAHFRDNYGIGMLVKYYNTSVFNCLCTLYPEYKEEYLKWYMFDNKPKSSFDSLDERREAMAWLRKEAGWDSADSFYHLSREDFDEWGLGGLIYYRKSDKKGFADTIIELNNDIQFDASKFNKHKTEQIVQKFLTKNGFEIDKHFVIYTSSRGGIFRMDIIIHSLKVIIEIDGPQHFNLLKFYQRNGHQVNLNRDTKKAQEAIKKGYTVIRIIQEECWVGKEKWITKHLLPLIKTYDAPQCIYLETTDKFKNIYNNHKLQENMIINDDGLYPVMYIN
jgi:very-short-patch-repair endonuclease